MQLLEAIDYNFAWPPQLLNITKECERIYYTRVIDQPEEMYLINQFASLFTTLLTKHPELAQDFQDHLDNLRKL